MGDGHRMDHSMSTAERTARQSANPACSAGSLNVTASWDDGVMLCVWYRVCPYASCLAVEVLGRSSIVLLVCAQRRVSSPRHPFPLPSTTAGTDENDSTTTCTPVTESMPLNYNKWDNLEVRGRHAACSIFLPPSERVGPS